MVNIPYHGKYSNDSVNDHGSLKSDFSFMQIETDQEYFKDLIHSLEKNTFLRLILRKKGDNAQDKRIPDLGYV